MNLASVDLVEELHQDKGVEDDGVVLRRRRVERSVAATVDVEHALTWKAGSSEGGREARAAVGLMGCGSQNNS